MPADNKNQMRRFIEEGWNRKDPTAFDDGLAPDFVSRTPVGDFRGPDGYRELYQGYVTAFPDCQFTIDALVGEGDMVSFGGSRVGPTRSFSSPGGA